jgi:hypothetical protein
MMTKRIVPNDVLGRAVSVLNIGSVVQAEIQVRFTINTLKLLCFNLLIFFYFSFRPCQM